MNKVEDILLRQIKDRRLLANVPDKQAIRKNKDRRGNRALEDYDDPMNFIISKNEGIRYEAHCEVKIKCRLKKEVVIINGASRDISSTGMLVELKDEKDLEIINQCDKLTLYFKILPGTMPEGYEMKFKIKGKKVRDAVDKDGRILCGILFDPSLSEYKNKKKGRYMLVVSCMLLFFISFFIVLMRAESIIYFKFNKMLYLYSIIAAVFLLSRYLFGMLYKPVPIDMDFTPSVTVVIPCFNEEEWIDRTILSCINQDYPVDKLEVIVVDDCSTDNSVEKIKQTIDKLYNEAERFETKNRLKYIVQGENKGKREALA